MTMMLLIAIIPCLAWIRPSRVIGNRANSTRLLMHKTMHISPVTKMKGDCTAIAFGGSCRTLMPGTIHCKC